ncbi:hypothetical protein GDO86_016561 [Hymenochirus boettgeri]|uniref:Olfactory receptor n=1 Tax=Hymenochirus boettgeri TaxID=247094 RepID=A0A8T2K0S1_9PIPI|nr:hypothetical protein GDO86_016561 [Hymenochirus boettgeri]
MEYSNETSTNRFILLGLANPPLYKAFCVLVFLIIYTFTLSGNSLLILVVRINCKLQTPMYFFLSNLSIIDIGFSSTIVPKLLAITLAQDKSVSLLECAVQIFFSLGLGGTECIILAVMAYDRYAAICKPLHYNRILNTGFCICLAVGSWIVSFISSGVHVNLTFQLPFCRSRYVNHFFCEIPALLRLSCEDPWISKIAQYITASIIAMGSFFLTLISYIHIISTILRIRSTDGRRKAFSTCTSHLTAVSIYYSTILFMYLRPPSTSFPNIDKIVSIIYTVMIPMLNPIIYSIRNKDVKMTIKKKLYNKIQKNVIIK